MPFKPRSSSRPFNKSQSGGGRPGGRPGERKRESRFPDRGPRFFQKKTCRLCAEHASLDFKDVERLRKFMTEKGKILPRRITGNCAKCQRMLGRALKRARHAALIAFQID